MPPADRLQRLRNLDRSSPGFPHQLIDILLEEDWVNWVQDLPPDEVGEPVECLDNVCAEITFVGSSLMSTAGPQLPQPHQSLLLSLPVRTPEDLWCPRGLTNIAHTPAPSLQCERPSDCLWAFGRCAQGDTRRFSGICKESAGLFQRQPRESKGAIPKSSRLSQRSKVPDRSSSTRPRCGSAWFIRTSSHSVVYPSTPLNLFRIGWCLGI